MSAMPSTTIVFGGLLALLGVGGYIASGAASVTALIPAFFGIPLIALGFLARSEAMRRHAMHGAAILGLLGCAGALFSLMRTPTGPRSPAAVFSQAAMVVLTAAFVALCVRSFKAARLARTAKGST
jgi:O-antigen/teichoic acid export membrane protein